VKSVMCAYQPELWSQHGVSKGGAGAVFLGCVKSGRR